jgi:hypothetical protein
MHETDVEVFSGCRLWIQFIHYGSSWLIGKCVLTVGVHTCRIAAQITNYSEYSVVIVPEGYDRQVYTGGSVFFGFSSDIVT